MKNKLKMETILRIVGIIVLVAVIGFSMVACGGDGGDDGGGGGGGGGTFTLTGIPSAYNGKYAFLVRGSDGGSGPDMPYEDEITLVGAKTINMSAQTMTLPSISNGKVTIPLWTLGANGSPVRYYGNDTVTNVVVNIFNSENLNVTSFPNTVDALGFEPIKFVNGSAQKTWSEGSGPGEVEG